MFQEALRSTRNTYQLIPLVSAILMVFAISLIPTSDLYTLASRQIKTAMGIDWSAYPQWTERTIEPLRAQKRQIIRETDPLEIFGGDQSDEHSIAAAWNLLSEHFSLFQPEVARRNALQTVVVEMNQSIETYIDSHTPEAALGEFDHTSPLDIYRYYHSPAAQQNAVLVGPDRDKARAELWNSIGQGVIHQTRYEAPTLLASEVSVTANVGIEALPLTRLGGGSDVSYRTVVDITDFRVKWLEPQTHTDHEYPQSRYTEASLEPVPDTSIAAWLEAEHPDIGITADDTGFIPFGGLEHVWREIADRPLIDADLYLNALAAEERKRGDKVSIMGVTVPAGLVPIAGPMALLYLEFNLLQLLVHVTGRAPRYRDDLVEVPWPVLHSQRGWWLHPLVCLIGLPIATQCVIALRMIDANPVWIGIGWALTACTTVCALIAGRHLVELRRVIPDDER